MSNQDFMARLLQVAQYAQQQQQRIEKLEKAVSSLEQAVGDLHDTVVSLKQMMEDLPSSDKPQPTTLNNAADMTYYLSVIEQEKVRKITMPSDLCVALVRLMDRGVTQKALMESGVVTQSKVRGLGAWTAQYTRAFAEVNDLMSVYNNPTSAEMLEKYPVLNNFTNNR